MERDALYDTQDDIFSGLITDWHTRKYYMQMQLFLTTDTESGKLIVTGSFMLNFGRGH